jgi:hypothetical protein
MASNIAAISNPLIRRLTIQKYRGVQAFEWRPSEGLNIILGGGDVGKTTILEAISLLLSPTGSTTLSGADFLDCKTEQGFEIEAVMSVPETCGINQQSKQAWPWPWRWDGKNPRVPDLEKGDGESTDIDTPVYCLHSGPPLYFGSYDGSVVLAAQEGRDIENVFINRIAHGRGAAVRIEALRSRMARIFRIGFCRSPFGVAGRRAERRTLKLRRRCTTLDPAGGATVVVAQPAGEFRE